MLYSIGNFTVSQNKWKLNHIEDCKSGVTDTSSDKAVLSAEDGLVFLNSVLNI